VPKKESRAGSGVNGRRITSRKASSERGGGGGGGGGSGRREKENRASVSTWKGGGGGTEKEIMGTDECREIGRGRRAETRVRGT